MRIPANLVLSTGVVGPFSIVNVSTRSTEKVLVPFTSSNRFHGTELRGFVVPSLLE